MPVHERTLLRSLRLGDWSARRDAGLLDEDYLPAECPFPDGGHVWPKLCELQVAYRERGPGWRRVPSEFERVAGTLAAAELAPSLR